MMYHCSNMNICISKISHEHYPFAYWDGTNASEIQEIFTSTNNASGEVRLRPMESERGTLELATYGDTGYHRSFFVSKDNYIINSNGKPIVYDAETFKHKFELETVAPTQDEVEKFYAGAGYAAILEEESLESQTSTLWDDFINLTEIREALNWYFNIDTIEGVTMIEEKPKKKCGGDCKCAKRKQEANSNIKTAMVYPITSDFDIDKFQTFVGEANPFNVTYRYTSAGRMFMGISIQTFGLFAVNITAGDSVVKLANGRLLHASATHNNS